MSWSVILKHHLRDYMLLSATGVAFVWQTDDPNALIAVILDNIRQMVCQSREYLMILLLSEINCFLLVHNYCLTPVNVE